MAQALPSYTYNSWVMVSIPVELPYGNKNDNNKGTVYGVLLMYHLLCVGGGVSLVAQMVENLPAMQETWVQSLGRENPLEKRMATFFKVNP